MATDKPSKPNRHLPTALSVVRAVCESYTGNDVYELHRKLNDSYPFPRRTGDWIKAWDAAIEEVLG